MLTDPRFGTQQFNIQLSDIFLGPNDRSSVQLPMMGDAWRTIQPGFLVSDWLAIAHPAFFPDFAPLISAEHSLLDDNGDGLSTPATMFDGVYAKSPKDTTKQADGRAAARTVLVPTKDLLSPEETQQRAKIEAQLDDLRSQKSKLADAEYLSRLEQLLIPLSKIYHNAEARMRE